MIDRTLIVTITIAVILMLTVLEMVRRRRLRVGYSLLWIVAAAAMVVLASSRVALARLAAVMGIYYPPSALVVIGFGFLTIASLHFSGVVSRLGEENTSLAQEIAILRRRVHSLEAAGGIRGASRSDGGGLDS